MSLESLVGQSVCIAEHSTHTHTGVVCAVLGTETKSGDFDVADVVFPGLPTPTDTAGKSKASADADAMDVDEEADEWVALASGLEVGEGGPGQEDWTSNAVKGELLAEWLRGEIGSDEVSHVLVLCDRSAELTVRWPRRIELELLESRRSFSPATRVLRHHHAQLEPKL